MSQNFILTSASGPILTKYNLKLNKFFRSIPRPSMISGGDNALVVTSQMPDTLQTMRFGYTSSFAEERMDLLNLHTELILPIDNELEYDRLSRIFSKLQYAESISLYRCIVLVDAFFVTSPDNASYLIHMQNRERPFAIAGIYSSWKNNLSGCIETGFTILTTASNTMLRRIGVDYMPVILSMPNTSIWLDLQQDRRKVYSLIHAYSDELMNGYPVSGRMSNEHLSISDLLPIGAKLKPEKAHSNLILV